MARLSDKYIAGFLDADGCIGVNLKAGKYKPLLELKFAQKASQDKVLYKVQDAIGGRMHTKTVNGVDYTSLELAGALAEKALNRIKKHLVIKRRYADVCLELVQARTPVNVELTRAYLKAQRKIKSLPLPNFPSRKWLAGYFDGDGCVHAVKTKTGVAMISVEIAASEWDTEGLEILSKNFGGGVYHMKGDTYRWVMGAVPSKAKEFFGYFAKHLITKRDQAEFVLGCAEMGHYRDGETIKSTLKQLKAREHRLSIPDVKVHELVSAVKRDYWAFCKQRNLDCCIECGTKERKHYAKGLCANCYMRGLARKQQSERRQVA